MNLGTHATMNLRFPAALTHLLGVAIGVASFVTGTLQNAHQGDYIGGGLGLVAVSTALKLFHDSKVTPTEILAVETDARKKADEFLAQGQTVAALVGKTADWDKAVADVQAIVPRVERYEGTATNIVAQLAALTQRVGAAEANGSLTAELEAELKALEQRVAQAEQNEAPTALAKRMSEALARFGQSAAPVPPMPAASAPTVAMGAGPAPAVVAPSPPAV